MIQEDLSRWTCIIFSQNLTTSIYKSVDITLLRTYDPLNDTIDKNEHNKVSVVLNEDLDDFQHQGGDVPQAEMYGDMICTQCLPKHQFLSYYVGLAGENQNNLYKNTLFSPWP